MAVGSPVRRRTTVAALLTLTLVTDLVDAVGYLRLGRVFVANLTGNVVPTATLDSPLCLDRGPGRLRGWRPCRWTPERCPRLPSPRVAGTSCRR